MCPEANAAASAYLIRDQIQSAAVMVPCPAAEEFIGWYREHANEDVGVHLTLNAEWQEYRWGPVSRPDLVPGLLDPDGYLWRDVRSTLQHAVAAEVEREIRAQIDRFIDLGIRPGHIDTHMGTLYSRPEYSETYFRVAVEYGLPAMVIAFTPPVAQRFREQGYPVSAQLSEWIDKLPLPKLDDFYAVPDGDSYDDKKTKFFDLVDGLQPGLSEIIFHPSVESERLKSITNSWQQRTWEAQLFADAEVQEFLRRTGAVFTNWKEVMRRYHEGVAADR
jgi:hypothetical protein